MPETKNFNLYIPASRRKRWAEFRDRIENEGKRACDVICDLVDEYLGVEKQ